MCRRHNAPKDVAYTHRHIRARRGICPTGKWYGASHASKPLGGNRPRPHTHTDQPRASATVLQQNTRYGHAHTPVLPTHPFRLESSPLIVRRICFCLLKAQSSATPARVYRRQLCPQLHVLHRNFLGPSRRLQVVKVLRDTGLTGGNCHRSATALKRGSAMVSQQPHVAKLQYRCPMDRLQPQHPHSTRTHVQASAPCNGLGRGSIGRLVSPFHHPADHACASRR